ncbi:MAG: alpha/beta hydrolase family protein [Candidatus Sigynarchaeota archaeon]
MVAYRVFYKQAVHVLSGLIILSNTCMIVLGIAGMLVLFDLWLDVLVEDVIIGTTLLNLAFIVIKWTNLNWRRNALAKRIHAHFSRYLAVACATIGASMLVTAVNVFIVDLKNPLHFLVDAIAIATFITTHLFAIAGGYLAYVSTRMGIEYGCEDGGSTPVWRFDCPITDDPAPARKMNVLEFLKNTSIGVMLLLLAIAVYGPFIFMTAGPSVEYWLAGNLSIFGVFLIVPVIFLLARQVPRTRSKRHRLLLLSVVITSSAIAAFNTIPLFSSSTSIGSLERQFASTFGTAWRTSIPASASSRFRDRPVALKDIILTIPIPAVDERHDIPYMEDKGKTLRFDWYGPAGISATSKLLPVIIALHPGSFRYWDKGPSNVPPTSRYMADQGFIVVDVQYGLYNGSAGTFTIKDMIVEIATLTRFLEAHANEYHVDLSRTYFLGRSSGSTLALVAGLAYDAPYFAGNFSSLLDCRGIIAFYAPTNISHLMGPAGGEELFGVPAAEFWHFNPIELVSPSSPPVLCFHGTADGVVPIAQAEAFQARMVAIGAPCILGTFNGAGHMFDIFYNNFYNQVCIYYMERFLALTAT